MTCIVGIIDLEKDNVLMGGDSAGVANLDICIRKDEKVFRVSDFVIGCTDSFRMIQLLRFSFNPPQIGNIEVYEYMCTDFINKVKECFRNGGYLQKYEEGDDKGGSFLVGYKNRLFKVENDFQVAETFDGYDSVGCGFAYALGSLRTTDNQSYSAQERVDLALKSAEYFSAGVSSPFVFQTS